MTKGPYTPEPSYRTDHDQTNVARGSGSAYSLSTTTDIADISLVGRRVMVIKKPEDIPKGATCEHKDMVECCEGCGHFSCSCGLTWDENAEGNFPPEDEDDFVY